MSSEWAGVDGGGGVAPSMSGTGQQGVGVIPRWWNPLDSAAIDTATVWAYRAQASVGSPWGFAPANYLETLQNWVNPGVNDLVEGLGAVPWAAATGWGFVAGNAQWFDTNVLPTSSYVMFAQYANADPAPALFTQVLCGASGGVANARFNLWPNTGGGSVSVSYGNGGALTVAPFLLTGNIAVIGQAGYRNGVSDGAIAAGNQPQFDIFLGCQNIGAPNRFITADLEAILICDDVTAFAGADITAIAGFPGGSMHNL